LLPKPVNAQEKYRKPPATISAILDVPPPPSIAISPTRDRLLLVQGVRYPPIADLAEPMLRLAGHRVNPRNNGPHSPPRVVGLTLLSLPEGTQTTVKLPREANLGSPVWSPDGLRFGFTNTTVAGIELWVSKPKSEEVSRLDGVTLNAAYGEPFVWMPDGKTLLCRTVLAGRGLPPQPPRAPAGPTVQESAGTAAPARTFPDRLRNSHDENLFDFYMTSQLVLVDGTTGGITLVGPPGLFAFTEPSPDGNHLLVARTHRPYSYLLPAAAFPKDVEVWDKSGKMEFRLASLPLEDRVPIEGVPTGPRHYHWRPTAPATLVWVEALDDGDPKKKVAHRDRLLSVKAPFHDKPVELIKTVHRFGGVTWSVKDSLALVRDYDRERRWTRTELIDFDQPETSARVVWDRSIQDRYKDPGTPVMRNSRRVLWQDGDSIFLIGEGATQQGSRPFLDRLNLATLKSERLFQCPEKTYETVIALLTADGSWFLTRRESPTEPPNYFMRTTRGDAPRSITSFPDPAPQLRKIKKELVKYQRPDGVQLSFTLYLPPDYTPGQRLPTVVWAYPREFTSADTAGQVTGSPYHFTTVAGPSHLFFLLEGYAVLDGATMPVVGDPETANDTYLEQIVASAKAAIDKADSLGVTDRDRVGVGGHSYGAFMTANLLAHSNLFRAGIARSGAYNRTLTPFGFQSERRTLWEAPQVYLRVSPFLHADKIKTPLLLIHGEADNNPGTFPIQTERMYQAIRGNGGTVRYVSLPYESHGYMARESVEHTLYEMLAWFDKYVKGATSQGAGQR
jgi:dipeptidyl aminopeptidase/acylaminoacyl peptidase